MTALRLPVRSCLPRRAPTPVVLAFLAAVLAAPAGAQPVERAFETLEIRLSRAQNVNRNFLHTYWAQGAGAELTVVTPFYRGALEAGGAFHRYGAEGASVPAFDALLLFAGWHIGVEAASRFRAEAGVRIGNYRMAFDEATFTGVRNENELTLVAQGGVAVRAVGPVALHAALNYQKTYTFFRLKLWYVTAGLSVRLRSPAWLREVLR